MGVEQRKTLIEQIQEKRGNSRLICCLTSDRDNVQGQIAKDFLFRFFQHLRSTPNLEKLDVLMFTLGGDTLAAYALGRLVRQFAKRVSGDSVRPDGRNNVPTWSANPSNNQSSKNGNDREFRTQRCVGT